MNVKDRSEQEAEHTGLVVIFKTRMSSHKITMPRTQWASQVQAPRHIGEAKGATVRVEVQETGANSPYVVMKAAPLHAVLHCFCLLGSAFRIIAAIKDVDPVESVLLPQPTSYARWRLNELLALDGPDNRLKFTLIAIARECGQK
ncbi:hypothetical protein LTR70_007804, partial [Exophiala xenobiotica]